MLNSSLRLSTTLPAPVDVSEACRFFNGWFSFSTSLIRDFTFYKAPSASNCIPRALTPLLVSDAGRRLGSLCSPCQRVHAVTSECGHKRCATNFTPCHLGNDWENWISASQYKGKVAWEQAVLVALSCRAL